MRPDDERGVHQANGEDDGNIGTPTATGLRGPYFEPLASKNVTALVGKTAYLNCRVRNLGNKTVSLFHVTAKNGVGPEQSPKILKFFAVLTEKKISVDFRTYSFDENLYMR